MNLVTTIKSCLHFILHGISLLVLILGTLENFFDQGGHLEYGTYFDKRAKKYVAWYEKILLFMVSMCFLPFLNSFTRFFFLYEVSFLCYRAFKKVQNFRILMVFATVNGIIIKNIIFFMICIGSLSNYWVNQGFVLEFQQFFSKCQKKKTSKMFFLPYDQKWLKF